MPGNELQSCSGECNRTLVSITAAKRRYHTVLRHIVEPEDYSEVALVGFSLGGNVILKYLGEQGARLHPRLSKAVVFSVPATWHPAPWNSADSRTAST